jgi:predicted phage tail protein
MAQRDDDPQIVVRRIADPRNLNRVAAKGTGKSGGTSGAQTTPHQPVEMPNTLRSRSTVRIVEVLSEGVVYGFANVDTIWKGIYLDGTVVQDPAGNFQFTILAGDFRWGYPSQDAFSGFSIAESPFGVGVECLFAQPVVRNLNVPLSACRIVLQIPALYVNMSNGDVVGTTATFAIDISVNGGTWTNVLTEQISGKTMSPYQRAMRIELPYTEGSIQIRVENLQPPPSSDTASSIIWSSYVEIVDGNIAYDDTCVVTLTVDAQQFPSVPSRAYLLDGIMVEIPNNYDPRARTYSGDWNGGFYVQWTNNPAWILYALLTNERWGLGRFLDVNAVDKWSFYEAAVNNDTWVPNGLGGYEPLWACNCVINTRQDALTVLNAVASSMIGQLYFANGTVFLTQDRTVPIAARLFGPADVIGGLFDYAGSDYRSRWTAVPVTWIDPDDQYNQATELVVDQAMVAQQGYREAPTQNAFGCTSRGQAQRFGRWAIYTNQFETEVVTFRTGLENADLRPGDIIDISDPQRAGARLAGRTLAEPLPNAIALDRLPDAMLANMTGWTIYVTVGSAAGVVPPVILTLTNLAMIDQATGRIQVGSGLTQPIPIGSMWLAAEAAVQPTSWRVSGVKDLGQALYEVTATQWLWQKFEYIINGVLIPPPPFSLTPSGPLLPPSNLTHTEYIYLDGQGWPQFGVILSWSASPDARVARYQLELSGPAGDYRRYSQIAGVIQDVPTMRQGPWQAVLIAFDNIGRRAQPVVYNFTPRGLLDLPLPPAALYLTPNGPVTTLTWIPTGEIDVVYYWVKWSPRTDGTATWERAVTSIAQVNRNTTQVTTPTRAGTFMIKTIDALGQESADWEEAILLQQITETVKVLNRIEEPTWAGDRGGVWHQNLSELWLPPPSAPEPVPPGVFPGDRPQLALNPTATRVGVYGFSAGIDLGIVCSNVSMVGIVEGYGTFLGVVMATWVPLASATPLAQGFHNSISNWIPLASATPMARGSSSQWEAHIEMAVSQDGVNYAPWTPLKSTIITGRAFNWRLIGTLYDLQTTLRALRAEVQLEIPLRNVQGDDAGLDGTGHLVVTYVVPFLDTPTVQLTARQSLAPGGNIVITESDFAHFKVEHRNAAGAPVAGGSIDYFVQGYGGHA